MLIISGVFAARGGWFTTDLPVPSRSDAGYPGSRRARMGPARCRFATLRSQFPASSKSVRETRYAPFAYGGNTYLEAFDAHGGWIASAADLILFATAVDGQRGPALLQPATVQAMITTPCPPTGVPSIGIPWVTGEVTAGLGWDVIPTEGGVAWSRVGALFGTSAAWLARRPDGATIAFTFNTLPPEYNDFLNDAIPALGQAVDGVRDWPARDLFSEEAPATPSA
jgi:hypothetical protein